MLKLRIWGKKRGRGENYVTGTEIGCVWLWFVGSWVPCYKRGVRYPSACYGSLSSYKICVCKGASCVLSRARSRPVSEESFYGKCIRTFESFLSNLLSDRSMLFSLSFFSSPYCRCTILCNSIQIEQINLHVAEKIERCTIGNFNYCARE